MADNKVPSYVNVGATPTPEIPEGGGIHATVGGTLPYAVASADEVAKAKAAMEADMAAHEAAEKAAVEEANKEAAETAKVATELAPKSKGFKVAPVEHGA